MENTLKSVYYAVENPGGYSGHKKLKDEASKSFGEKIKDDDVREWLLQQDVYTLYRTAPVNFRRNRILVDGIDKQFQADLVDMGELSEQNDGVKFMLVCIDTFSKYGWIRCLKNKKGSTVAAAFEDILSEGRIPVKLQTDKGTEFFNKEFSALMKKFNVTHFATASETKASVVERLNRTIKCRMYRYLEAQNSKRYIDVIQDLISAYNRSFHRSIKMRPIDATTENEKTVFDNLYGKKDTTPLRFRYKPGDTVRISKTRRPFQKGYKQSFTDEFFTISERVFRKPPVYRLKDQEGELIEGTFYEQELQKIIVPPDFAFKIEEIVSRKKIGKESLVLVKWKGWPDKFNSWIKEREIIHLA